MVIKTVVILRKEQRDQWDRIGSPEIDLCKSSLVISGRGVKTILCRKDSLFNKWCCKIMSSGHPQVKKKRKGPRHRPYIVKKIYSEKIINLNESTEL